MTEPTLFPFLARLEADWKIVLEELNHIIGGKDQHGSTFQPWHETGLYDGQWDVFGLHAFGNKLGNNCELAPRTTALVESIPGLVTAGFSALVPGTVIKPHVGYTSEVLRCHLGLITTTVPTDCGLRVADTVHNWAPGKAFVFDDTLEHEAWNRGDRTRYILLVDFKK
ncbi:MAG: aspartyl/asparaginyl beta-hydroxylase domain-containing protein [Flavobacteriales bacterium]|nr:aspartyl/asparaginyl beta-hydroxylase domain-containing protein [Flavobacteriales bacterium]